MPCPPAGSGVHSWLLGAANRCRNIGLSSGDTADLLQAETATCGREVSNKEISDTIAKCYAEAGVSPTGEKSDAPVTLPKVVIPRGIRPKDVAFDPGRLTALTAKVPPIDDDWFRRRSPIDVSGVSAADFIGHLYRTGEQIHIFTRFDAKTPAATIGVGQGPWDSACLAHWQTGHGAGVWFLPNPTDGQWHPTEAGGSSCRNWRAVTAFRFVVLESDTADPNQWMAALIQFPIPIAAVYTSGGRSIHALWQLNAATKEEWDQAIAKHKPPLKIIGADPGCLSAVRLSRLPQCQRADKGAMQKLLFLNPTPAPCPLAKLPTLRS